MSGRIDAERILGAFLAPEPDRLPDRVLEAALADVARTPQRRALRVPWRFPPMPVLSRATAVAAVALVAAVGVGGALYLNAGFGTPRPTPPPASTPAPSPTLPAGIPAWTPYTSAVYGFTFAYPSDWSVTSAASRAWQATDLWPPDGDWPWADAFTTPEQDDDAIGLLTWEMPPGEGADVESFTGLKAVAQQFCTDATTLGSCDGFTRDAQVLCYGAPNECGAALLVPTEAAQYAFFEDATSRSLGPTVVRVVVIARPNDFPTAARYGGSVELLRSILTTMDVHAPGR